MLKTDLHLHCKGDPQDTFITHTPEELIDRAAKLKFDVLSLTLHNRVLYNNHLVDYAKRKNILLIQGTEATIEGGHVLVYNITEEERKKLKTFDDLEKIKDQVFTTAAHPFFFLSSVGNDLITYNTLFDAVEYSHFYTTWLNRNNRGKEVADTYNKPMIGNSDAHMLETIGCCYSFVDADKNKEDIFAALRKKKVEVKTQPLPTFTFLRKTIEIISQFPACKIRAMLAARESSLA